MFLSFKLSNGFYETWRVKSLAEMSKYFPVPLKWPVTAIYDKDNSICVADSEWKNQFYARVE